MSNVSVFCFLASYLVAFVLECLRLVNRGKFTHLGSILFAAAGLVAHTFYLLERSRAANLPPLLSSTHDWLLVLAWLAIAFYLFLSVVDRTLSIGLFLLPLVLVLVGAAYFVSSEPNRLIASSGDAARDAFHYWAMLHATLLVFGIGVVMLGLVFSIMYLVQHRRLKRKAAMQTGLTLPSLQRLARLNWWAVILSVPLLTLGMATGIGLAIADRENAMDMVQDPVVVVNGVLWLFMVAFFSWLITTRRTTGKQVAWLTLWAFGFLLVTVIGLLVAVGGDSLSGGSVHQRLSARDM